MASYINKYYKKSLDKSSFKGIDSYSDYSELISRDDIDAVLVVTPDHWHALNSIHAMEAGKDVYCEKPLAHTVVEGRKMVEVLQKNKRVLQTGSMQRSSEGFWRACELVRNGYIGGPAIPCDLPAEKTPAALDWDRWQGPAEERPYNAILAPPISFKGWPNWRKYAEYGGGGIADWGAHMFDIAQWGLGMDETGPVKIIVPKEKGAVSGLKFIYGNGIEMVHEEFGRGWGVEFVGSEGVLRVSRSFLEADPAKILDAEIPDNGIKLYRSINHYQDWLDCIKSRKQPICDVETGHRSSTVCNIANIGYWLGKDLNWDPVKEKFDDNDANKLLTRNYRKPYTL